MGWWRSWLARRSHSLLRNPEDLQPDAVVTVLKHKINSIDILDSQKKESLTKVIAVDYDMAKACMKRKYFAFEENSAPLPKFDTYRHCFATDCKEYPPLKQISKVHNLNEEIIDTFVNLNDVKSVQVEGKVWPAWFPAYSLSKMTVNA
eukprot:Gb_33306 [translate_table: standard]